MTAAPVFPDRILSKSKFSMYLRTQCDKQLYLSLFKNSPKELSAAGIPVPLKSRPGVQLITGAGREFEWDQFDQLINSFPGMVAHQSNGRTEIDLLKALITAKDPTFILQPTFEPEKFRNSVLDNLGLSNAQKQTIPVLTGLRPDVVFVHTKDSAEFEILPDGSRRVVRADDCRLALSVIDLKNVAEGNASYSGEVCLYAFFLSNWLAIQDITVRNAFFVSDRIYLWKHAEMPQFNDILAKAKGARVEERLKALMDDLQDGIIDYLIYMPSVRKFFKEDVPRVVEKGDTQGWGSLEYHVNPKCSACDFLGHADWLNPDDRAFFASNPTHYCIPAANGSDHLSRMPNLSKGATQILAKNGHPHVTSLVGVPSTTPVLKKHTLLKRERSQIGFRAHSITNSSLSVDQGSKIASLAKRRNLEVDIVVNFDAGSGFLTGIGMRAFLSPPFGKELLKKDGTRESFHSYGEQAFVVPKENLNAEWVVIQGFIEKLADWFNSAETKFRESEVLPDGWGLVHTQICFWEERQYEELCNAFGRHLPRVLNLNDRSQRALAWIFPAEQLIEREAELAPGIVFIQDVVNLVLRAPVTFSNTLLRVAEHYHANSMSPRSIDKYYRELLGNSIPRERIFEIWKSKTGTLKMYGKEVSITEGIKKYEDVLKANAWALSSITARLRSDLSASLQGNAPALNNSIFQGATSVAFDSKLWIQWDKINGATAETESKAALISNVERLESAYKAIVLTRMTHNYSDKEYEFDVSEDSTEAKLEEKQSYYVLGMVNEPGFPLFTAARLGLMPSPGSDQALYYVPFFKLITVSLIHFDRINRKARIKIRPWSPRFRTVFDELFNSGLISVGTQSIYLIDGVSPDFSSQTTRVLRSVGNPSIATPAPETLAAMGVSSRKSIPVGSDSLTPAAEVLWNTPTLAAKFVRNNTEATGIANAAVNLNRHSLNQSQIDAVRECSKAQLSVIWGPPGTGKTDTLVAFVHALVKEAQSGGKTKKILVTGPNYRAVEELIFRLHDNLQRDTTCVADMFMVYSRSREPKALPSSATHLRTFSFKLDSTDPDCQTLTKSLSDVNSVSIVATTIHQVLKITEFLFGTDCNPIQAIYDLVVIDESSQVEVVRSIQAFAVLKGSGQLVIAGDHLQMPPILHLDAPVGAEHLVGSIQTYILTRHNLKPQTLLINYRSNQDLVDYAKTIGYPQGLTAASKKKQLREVSPLQTVVTSMPDSLPLSRLYKELLDPSRTVTALIHEDIVSSQANEVEAKIVAGLAYCLRHSMANSLDIGDSTQVFNGFNDSDFFQFGIGVVTPHKAQKALVIRELTTLFPAANPELIYEAVDTVEKFQGGQRQTIIISFGVGDVDIIEGEEEFLLQKERTNVAVSRAEGKSILIMPKSLAYHLPSDHKAAKTSRALKSYIEEFCANRSSVDIELEGSIFTGEVRCINF